jgi:hypothetical protein
MEVGLVLGIMLNCNTANPFILLLSQDDGKVSIAWVLCHGYLILLFCHLCHFLSMQMSGTVLTAFK